MSATEAMPTGPSEPPIAGRYRLESLIGRGGSAEVWRAQDEALERKVALKLVTGSGGEDAGRVGDEARLLARLSHPGLVPVYDAGTDDSGRPWVVMELVEGGTLADEIARGPIEPVRVAHIGQVLAEALCYVHQQGLVHRDIKPANVLLGRDGRVRLTDFGIARLVDAARVTATGLTVGTASYLAPEQVTGSDVGPRADLYSLGLVLLEALTGEREYPGSAVEVALARLHRQPEVPADLPDGWPGLLVAMTALEADPRPTAEQVARDLSRITSGGQATTVLATAAAPPRTRTQVLERPPPHRPVPYQPPPRSNSAWAWALLLFALVAAGVVTFVLIEQNQSETNPPAVPKVQSDLPRPLQNRLKDLIAEEAG